MNQVRTSRPLNTLRNAALASPFMIVLVLGMNAFYPVTLPTLPAGYFTPILAIEFVASLAHAQALFAGDTALLARTQTGHWIDMGFLLAYGSFLALANLGCWQWQRRRVSLAGAGFAVLAALADCAENLQLLQLGNALQGTSAPPDFSLLRLCVDTKFAGIALSMLCLVPLLWPHGWAGKGFASVSALLAPVTLAALTLVGTPATNPLVEVMAGLIVPGWILLLVWLVRIRKVLQPDR